MLAKQPCTEGMNRPDKDLIDIIECRNQPFPIDIIGVRAFIASQALKTFLEAVTQLGSSLPRERDSGDLVHQYPTFRDKCYHAVNQCPGLA